MGSCRYAVDLSPGPIGRPNESGDGRLSESHRSCVLLINLSKFSSVSPLGQFQIAVDKAPSGRPKSTRLVSKRETKECPNQLVNDRSSSFHPAAPRKQTSFQPTCSSEAMCTCAHQPAIEDNSAPSKDEIYFIVEIF